MAAHLCQSTLCLFLLFVDKHQSLSESSLMTSRRFDMGLGHGHFRRDRSPAPRRRVSRCAQRADAPSPTTARRSLRHQTHGPLDLHPSQSYRARQSRRSFTSLPSDISVHQPTPLLARYCPQPVPNRALQRSCRTFNPQSRRLLQRLFRNPVSPFFSYLSSINGPEHLVSRILTVR
jgi:hypothetical protein